MPPGGHNQSMSDEPRPHTSKLGAILVAVAVGGSAIGVVGWHLMSNRGAGLDTSGFDVSVVADAPRPVAAPVAAPLGAPAPLPQSSSLGMMKADEGMSVVTPGGSASKPAEATKATPREAAALTAKEVAIKNEKFVDGFIRRMQKKHPSIGQYGKDWAASPELRALRDQYWKDKDPLKFAHGLSKSGDFGKLVKKYGKDPGIRDVLMTGLKEAPSGVIGAISGVFQNDAVTKNLLNTVMEATGLPKSLTGMITGGGDAKMPDKNQIMGDIMNSPEAKAAMKNQPAAVPLDQKAAEKAPETNNGFRPLGGR